MTNGLVQGGSFDSTNYQGRLNQKTWAGYGGATVFGKSIENRPLWKFIDTSLSGLPAVCGSAAAGPSSHADSANAVAEAAFNQARADMASCLAVAPDGLFVSALYDSPRLTIVPRYHQSVALGSNACCYDILGFEVVFLDAIWTSNGSQWSCNGGMINDMAAGFCRHEPGRTGSITIGPPGQRKIDSASAIVLSCRALPNAGIPADEKCKKVEHPNGNVSTIFLDLFLTK